MKGFTVLEMILVLSVISIVFLITLPNIQQKREIIQTKGCDALVEVVNSQILLYQLEHDTAEVDMDDLVQGGYLKENQRACPNGKRIVIRNGQAEAK